ncbi:MAG: Ig-like domain-containing protein [Planctomycetaceae bacterium]|jgi:hypothetical protein|nr:Ig-like domain-containing protein [Planctomycetaceae bacterium]
MLQKFIFMLLVISVVLLTGCGNKGPSVRFVEGTVTFEGKPVSKADVCFTPKSVDGIPATGITDANGVYHLTSAQGGEFSKGAVAGEYDVRIMKYLDLDAVAPENPQIGDIVPLAKPKHHLPEKYADVKTSGLSATVKKGKNTLNFDLVE